MTGNRIKPFTNIDDLHNRPLSANVSERNKSKPAAQLEREALARKRIAEAYSDFRDWRIVAAHLGVPKMAGALYGVVAGARSPSEALCRKLGIFKSKKENADVIRVRIHGVPVAQKYFSVLRREFGDEPFVVALGEQIQKKEKGCM